MTPDPQEDGGVENALPEWMFATEHRGTAIAWIADKLFWQQAAQDAPDFGNLTQQQGHRLVAIPPESTWKELFENAEARWTARRDRLTERRRIEATRREAQEGCDA